MGRYRVLLVDDEEKIRQEICRKMAWEELGFELAGEAANGMEALEIAEQTCPDVVLTDIKMPYMDGLELGRRLHLTLPAAKLVFFSGFDDFEYARQAVGIHAFEYILKPISAQELCSVLERIRDQLDKQREERQNIQVWQDRYEQSLPLLREFFYSRLLSGKIPAEQIEERAAEYGLSFPSGVWAVAIASVKGEGLRIAEDAVLLSAMDFLTTQFSLPDAAVSGALFDGGVALMAEIGGEERFYAFLEELERLCLLAETLLGLRVHIGVGTLCHNAAMFCVSAAQAQTALEYKVIADSRVLYIRDVEPRGDAAALFGEVQQQNIIAAVKLGSEAHVREVIEQIVEQMRSSHISIVQCQLFFLESLLSLMRAVRSGAEDSGELFEEEAATMLSADHFRSLEDMSGWLTEHFLRIREILGRRRNDTAGRSVHLAKEYIAEHYHDGELSVERLCEVLHLSPAYFSTLFKKETGLSFINYLTQVRMEKAAELLRTTDEKTYAVAEQTGYPDANYFSYVFKRHFGVTPSKFRASERG